MEIKATTKDLKRRSMIINDNMIKVMLMISLPLILLNLFNYMYGIIDTIIVSNMDSDGSSKIVSSVVMIDQLKNLISSVGTGLATGGSIIVSRLIGKSNYTRAKTMANTLLIIGFAISVVSIAVFVPLARPILRLANLTDELIDIGYGYFIVQIVTVGVTMLNTVFWGLEKARGATQNILYINFGVMLVKVALTVLFVYGLGMGTTMVAVATLLANLVITVYAVVMLLRRKYLFKLSIKDTCFHKEMLVPLAKLSVPVFLGRFVFSAGKVIVNSNAMHYGESAPGALGVSNHISGSVTSLNNSVEESTSMIISQNIGAGKMNRVFQAFWTSLGLNLLIGALGVAILTIFSDGIVAFFSNGDAQYAQLISKIFSYEKIGIMALALASASMGLIYGLGYTKLSMLVNLARLFVFRIPSIYIMMYLFPEIGAEALGIAMLISNSGIGLMSIIIATVCLIRTKQNKYKDTITV